MMNRGDRTGGLSDLAHVLAHYRRWSRKLLLPAVVLLSTTLCLADGVPPSTPPDGDGIGGTGVHLAEPEGFGGTGIVGTITGFGSIRVNGLEVQFQPTTPVDSNGQAMPAANLGIGQVVVVEAAGSGQQLVAQRISVSYPLVGVVTRVDLPHRMMYVMGRPVSIAGLPVRQAARLATGQFVRLSGLRSGDGVLHATSLAEAPSGLSSITGRLTLGAGRQEVAGLKLEGKVVDAGNDEIVAEGMWNGQALQVSTTRPAATAQLWHAHGLSRLELEGFAIAHNGNLQIAGHLVGVDATTGFAGGGAQSFGKEQLVQVSVKVLTDGRLVAERVQVRLPYHGAGQPAHKVKTENDNEHSDNGETGARPHGATLENSGDRGGSDSSGRSHGDSHGD
ncbi:DUF5666 domain-containing protein [Vogesella sp. LIG4]|uniref:DUF5666 domain-containing protein n=1 Tax=Vogesella sp. LIG4 TaxID=1192162 RepID=UPI00081FE85C|nr:DUF5666 domain-containing protein [Vogesella sp. LIG4]SCK26620.1 hypothetical protein PSELUDRAFT_3216 [Vogesella sp. LIG4]